jgi:ABC-type multidrug transport system fused ATPase/permease subunit
VRGKSTLLSLVPRFYDPTSGRLTLDGRDIREITKKSLRQQIAIVLQDTLLFSTTVRENIAYGRPDATDEEIREAARRAQADEFISQLPNGYESEVGERGGHLSVGQRQRIGIARAFLKNAPILLLDEPTSALDPTTESAIMETIKDLMRGRTTIIITHRIATIHNVDQIVVLEGGRVVEQGRGPELVARGGVYANFTLPGNSTHEQRRRGPQSRKRLVGASDPAECRFWRGVLLRNGTGVSLHENERAARTPLGRSCFSLRRLFLCSGSEWLGRCW